jgi:P63C domain.
MDNEKDLHATHIGTVKIGSLEIPCAVLNNGKRVFIQREIVGLLTGNKKGGFDRYLKPNNLRPYLPEKFKEKGLDQTLFSFKLNTRQAQAFEATDLIDICMMYINARNDNKLLSNQIQLATQSLVIVSAFAKTGVIAVIDEATGFLKDKNRAKDAFQKFLSQFMREDAAKLVKRFEDSFFEMIYRMRGWTWNYAHKHPGVVGIWINDIVYERIAPAVLSELKKKNPVNTKGGRKHKHHQFLSDEVGVPKLLNHLAAVEALGRASGYNWNKFMEMLDTAFPKQYQQMSFLFDESDETNNEPLSNFNKNVKQALDYNPNKDKKNKDDDDLELAPTK